MRRDGIVLAALCLLAVMAYLPVLGLSFFSDDFSILYRIGMRHDLSTGSFFRPLPDWTHYVNHLLAGPTPWAFRIVNVLLLGINGWLVYLLAHRLLGTIPPALRHVPLFAGVLFVLHPFHNEPQLWIIGRSTAMSTGFILVALVIALGPGSLPRRSIGVGVAGVLGALCYESALLLPGLLTACAMAIPRNERRGWAWMLLVSGMVVALNLLARAIFTGHVANAYGGAFFEASPGALALRCAKALARLFVPPLDDERGQLVRAGILVVVLAVIAFVLWRQAPRYRRLFLSLGLMVLVSSAIGTIAGVSTRTSESDRFLYLPSAFLCILVALAIGTLVRGRAQVAVVGVLGVLSWWAMRQGHANWKVASRTIAAIVQAAPTAPPGGRVFVHGLPGDHRGAFILRHGFHEALLYAGKDTTGLVRADTLLWGHAANGLLPALSFEDRDDTLMIGPNDGLMTWNGTGFEAVERVMVRP